ncbi:hypothetical protein [Phaffia rhodozyma]|uniref:Uncharacterized protein n=1 Tax=Phaffia rhodozyma TaxID=264483 RepID=A0A0F7SGJ6_PHARH|nr:hypothetical protein [Phaffia rhodozyma]
MLRLIDLPAKPAVKEKAIGSSSSVKSFQAAHKVLSINPLLTLILTYTPSNFVSALLVSSEWYHAFIPVCYHTVLLRRPTDLIAFLSIDHREGAIPHLKTDALRKVRHLAVSMDRDIPVTDIEWHRLGPHLSDVRSVLPSLRVLQFAQQKSDMAEWTASIIESHPPSTKGILTRLLRCVEPTDLWFGPMYPTSTSRIDHVDRSEVHHRLTLRKLYAFQSMLKPLYQNGSLRRITFDRTFFHLVSTPADHPNPHYTRTPQPTFFLPARVPSSSLVLELYFAPLVSAPIDGDGGPSLNPWDQRTAIIKQAGWRVRPTDLEHTFAGEVHIRGVGRSLWADIRAEVERKDWTGRLHFHSEPTDPEEIRSIPDLTPAQLQTLFYHPSARDIASNIFSSTSLSLPILLSTDR